MEHRYKTSTNDSRQFITISNVDRLTNAEHAENVGTKHAELARELSVDHCAADYWCYVFFVPEAYVERVVHFLDSLRVTNLD